jgi:hypothetical protein
MRERDESLEVKGHSSYLLDHRASDSTSVEERLPEVHVFISRLEFVIKMQSFVVLVTLEMSRNAC